MADNGPNRWYECSLSNSYRTGEFVVRAPDKDIALARLFSFAIIDPANEPIGFFGTPADELFDPIVVEAAPDFQDYLTRSRGALAVNVIAWTVREHGGSREYQGFELYTAAPPHPDWPLRK